MDFIGTPCDSCESKIKCRPLNSKDFLNKDDHMVKELFKNGLKQNYKVTEVSTLEYFDSSNITDMLRARNLNQFPCIAADDKKSDLESRTYEGGFKIWECTFDLLKFIEEKKLNFKNQNILDLGCGAGLVGILGLKRDANVFFQDYNHEVLKFYTFANIQLNDFEVKDCGYFAGSWKCFTKTLPELNNKFDYIFTSETIYNLEDYEALHSVFEESLNQNGVVFLAAKAYYFGLGSGIVQFQQFLDKKSIFKYRTIQNTTNGLSRVILEIRRKDSKFLDE